MDAGKLRQFLAMHEKKRALEAELETVKEQMAVLEAELLQQFEQEGVSSMKVNGKTVYLDQKKWAGVAPGASREAAIQAIKEAGLDMYVKEDFSTQSLSAYVRELLAQAPLEIQMDKSRWHEVLPPTFEGVISVTERVSLRVRGK